MVGTMFTTAALSVGLFVLQCTVFLPVFSCPDGWEMFQNHCYLFESKSLRSWSDSKEMCEWSVTGGHLVSIGSRIEMDYISRKTPKSEVKNWWTSGRYDVNRSLWYWDDGKGLEIFPTTLWEEGPPNLSPGPDNANLRVYFHYDETGLRREDSGRRRFSHYICEVESDCPPVNPCENGGLCISDQYTYHCECLPGYVGQYCDKVFDHCDPNPCQNAGTCMDYVSRYECRCTMGHTGKDCQTAAADVCRNNPCRNSGTCEPNENGYYCHCPLGYVGTYCQTGWPRSTIIAFSFVAIILFILLGILLYKTVLRPQYQSLPKAQAL